jgi:hypothetical protein
MPSQQGFELRFLVLLFSVTVLLTTAATTPDTSFTFCTPPNLAGQCTFNSVGAAAVGTRTNIGKCLGLATTDDKATMADSIQVYPNMICCFSSATNCPCRPGAANCDPAVSRCMATCADDRFFVINNTATEASR